MGGKFGAAVFRAVFLFFPLVASANVVINEICPTGCASGDHQWIELYNFGESGVDLNGWKLWEFDMAEGHGISTSTSEQCLEVSSRSFAILTPAPDVFRSDHPDISVPVFESNFSLTKAGKQIGLRDNLGELLEPFVYPDQSLGGSSLERVAPTSSPENEDSWKQTANCNSAGKVNSCWNYSLDNITSTPTSTPATPTSIEDVVSSTITYNLFINEIYPNPISGEEWVEIYNPNTLSVQLDGWKLYDGVGERSAPTGTIPASGFFVIDFTSVLNNSGDILILKNDRGENIDQLVYGNWVGGGPNAVAPATGNSLARKADGGDTGNDANDFGETVSTTRGLPNIISAPIVPTSAGSSGASGGSYSVFVENKSLVTVFSDNVKLNELVSDPADGQTEFVELKNVGSLAIDLAGGYLKDGGGTKTELSGIIYAGNFMVIDSPRGNLNNSGDLVTLYAPNNSIKDTVAYGDWKSVNVANNAPRSDDPTALARSPGGLDTGIDRNDWAVTSVVTRGVENIIISKNIGNTITTSTVIVGGEEIVTSSVVGVCVSSSVGWEFLRISEVLPNPVGDEVGEFVEIENTATSTVDLCGLMLDDEDGGSRPYKINTSTVLGPHEFLVFDRKETELAFNNDADEARILMASGTVLYSVNYEKGGEGKSYSLGENGDWYWVEPSPSLKNKISEAVYAAQGGSIKAVAGTKIKKSNQSLVRSLSELVGSTKGDYVDVVGVVSVPPGVFGAQYFFIYSTSTEVGAEVYMNKKNFPALRIGDVVRVRGTVSESYGQKRINTKTMSDITRFDGGVDLSFTEVAMDSLGAFDNGALVSVSGEVTEVKTSYVYLDDGTDEIKIYFKKGTGMNVKPYVLGDRVRVRGLLINTSKELQIQPREKNDVVIENLKVAGEKIASVDLGGGFDYGHAILLATTIIFAVYGFRNSGIGLVKKIGLMKK